jgi:predicted metal-dependent hydrolase
MIQPNEIIRSRRKTLAITIDSFGRLIVRAPLQCSEQRIYAFLQEKEGWIVRKVAEKKGAGIELPPENLHGYGLLLLAKKCKIYVVDTPKVAYNGEENSLYLPLDNPKERLVKWLKENAKRIFTQVTAQTAVRMGVSYQSVGVTSARGRWGSCSGKNAIHFSFRLLYAPKDVIEYVIVHELAHTKHHNHSKAFWAEVAKFVPDWKVKRAWLKQHGGLMEIF